MNKAELIEAITDRMGDKRTASTAVESIVDAITRSVAKGEKVAITGFGVFEKIDRAARTARNPATGAAVKLKKTSVPKFRPGQGFKDVVSGARKVAPLKKAAATAVRGATGRTGASASTAATPAKSTRANAAKAPATKASAAKAPATRAAKAPATKAAAPRATATKAAAKAPAKAPATKAAKAPAAKAQAAKATKASAAKAPSKKAPAKKAAAR